ncbi:MAG: prephenate dehydratase [Bacteroidales bacterium]
MKRIAIQGIAGSFHEDATRKYFNEEVEIIECRTFKQICEAVDNNQADYAVMAIENSIAGSILGNYGLIREYHLRVQGEVYIHIQMNLMALEGVTKTDIIEVFSHPVAIAQCQEYLVGSLPNATVTEKSDTAASAKIVKEKGLKNTAAIGNKRSAEIYGLNIIAKGIETNKKNYTRFWILSKKSLPNKDADKSSICLEVGHYHGALVNVLNVFAKNKINLTKIQSVPIIGKPNEYCFHLDLEWKNTSDYEKAIHEVLKGASSVAILGEYKHGDSEIHQQ